MEHSTKWLHVKEHLIQVIAWGQEGSTEMILLTCTMGSVGSMFVFSLIRSKSHFVVLSIIVVIVVVVIIIKDLFSLSSLILLLLRWLVVELL